MDKKNSILRDEMITYLRWENKVALVTGASTGIGKSVALSLSRIGMTVVVMGRRKELLEKVKQKIDEEGNRAFIVVCDISDEQAVLQMFSYIKNQIGRLDVIVNNAGIGYESMVSSFETFELKNTLDVNVVGAFVCIREAIKLLNHREDTAIITISSLAAHRVPEGLYGLYSASKHAVKALVESLRKEFVALNSPTKIGIVSPGTVATEFHQNFSQKNDGYIKDLNSQYLCPEDVADAVLYILTAPKNTQINDILLRPIGQRN